MSKNESLDLRRLLVVSRPFWWVNTGVPFLVGAMLGEKAFSLPVLVGFLYFLIPYNLLMYGVNDIYDYESDIKNPRKNGSVNGSVLPKAVHGKLWLVMLLINAPFWLYFLTIGNPAADIFLGLTIFMVFAYSVAGLRFKERPVIDSLTSAFHYSSPFIYGLLLFQSPSLWPGVFFGFYFWVAANHAFGAIQDIIPDREAGIDSIATRLGAAATLYFSIVCYLAAAIIPPLFYGPAGLLGTLAVTPYLILVVRCLPYRRKSRSRIFARSWSYFLRLNYVIGGAGSVLLLYLYNR